MLRFRSKEEYYSFIEENASKSPSNSSHLRDYIDYPENVDNVSGIDKVDKNYLSRLKEIYNVNEIAGSGNTLEKVRSVMGWLTDNTFYCGYQPHKLRDETMQILKYGLKNDFKHAINCRFKAIALTDLLVCIGLTAKPLELVSPVIIDDKFNTLNIHFMVNIYIPELDKWIVADPSFNVIFKDKQGNILDIFELRKALVNSEDVVFDGYTFNGSNTRCIEEYKTVFLEDTLEFILTWQSNVRKIKPLQRLYGAEFNYMCSPIGDNFFDRCKGADMDNNIRKWLLKREKEIIPVGKDYIKNL